ncbi:hypothetical protein GQ43DRAFT_378045, partial [Delitschia confertaspora ATCC 74209]
CHALSCPHPPPLTCCSSFTSTVRLTKAMPPSNGSPASSKTSSTPAVSSLRPRTRRLVSIDDELNQGSASEYAPSPFGSRTASPIPRPHLSRTHTLNPSSTTRSASATSQRSNNNTPATLSDIWSSSWTAIQSLASNVLGDTSESETQGRRRRPLEATHRRTSTNALPKQWGPKNSLSSQIGAGSQEERENMVRALKRRDMLTANEHLVPDSVGRFKRRNSDENVGTSTASLENEEQDALVYLHHVRPEDTLAGITIKYNCQAAVLRKANRMWPNDSVQTKKIIVLPVDACGVKGRPVAGPHQKKEEDLLLGDYGDGTSSNDNDSGDAFPNGWHPRSKQPLHSPPPSSSHCTNEPEQPWKHDSWVRLPNETTPIEIGRMPRRALGFFPPARRKSNTFSDATPTPSLDLPRSSTSTYRSNSQTHSPSYFNSKSVDNPGTTTKVQQRNRSLSNSFSLHGPGGVGTLGKNVRSPGPAEDPLNKLFASHLNIAPPPGQEVFTPWIPSLLQSGSNSGVTTPLGGGGIDLENIGGAVEGWMRKMASKASSLLAEQNANTNANKRSAVPGIGAVGGDLGDLIELRDDAFELGGEERDAKGNPATAGQLSGQSKQLYQNSRAPSGLDIRERGRRAESRKTD